MSGVLQALLAGFGGAATDEYFEYVTMLLPGNGTNGAQNNTFLDSSTNNFTITRNGNTTQGTFTPYGSNWSNYFDGSGDYQTLSSNASMDFGTGNFTIEGWFFTGDKSVSVGASRTIIGNSGNSYTMQVYISTSGLMTFGNTGSTFLQGAADLANNTWHHFAISRSGTGTNQIAMWVDGTRVAQGTNNQNYVSGTIYIGAFDTGSGFWNGYISNLRIVKGSAVYDPTSSSITVPTSPLTAITNTSLLTCQSNRFIDNSSNNFTITVNGDVSVQRFSPFNPTTPYAAGTIGGSGYFDGTGDFLTLPSTSALAFGTGDFTVEMWVYTPAATSIQNLFTNANASTGGDTGFGLFIINTTQIRFASWNTTFLNTGSNVVVANQWNHIAVSRSGTTASIFVNGIRQATGTVSNNFSSTNAFYVGTAVAGGDQLTGYISNLRAVKGTAVYDPTQSTLTVPTAPLTAVTNTQLLCSFTNGGIIDNAMMNDLETVGNAQISTSVSKFGGGSIYLDGTGDNLTAINRENFNFGTGDFTVEFWINASASGTYTQVVGTLVSGTEAGTWRIGNRFNSTNAVYFARGNGGGFDELNAAVNVNDGAWHHVAVTRASGTVRIFVDGTLGASSSITGTCSSSNQLTIGYNQRDNTYVTGYIDDLRITKGYARYTANFTPPTQAFPTQ